MGKPARNFFSSSEQEEIVNAIKKAEAHTSGEIRVHLENACKGSVMIRAEEVFKKSGMHKTKEHNGVLFYLAVKTKDFAVAGDSGIHQKVTQEFWEKINKLVLHHFSEGRFAQGLCEGITLCGEQLQKHFPVRQDDVNEQSDEISFS
ncbi:MAG: TPM domain-containing protein [Bacteroidia bacterium]